MSTFSCVAEAAEEFRNKLLAVPGIINRPCLSQINRNEEVLWDNLLLSSLAFRYGHVETFQISNRLSILHVCLFPHLDDIKPIFGFDMVAGPSKVTGIFLDLSGTVGRIPLLRLRNIIDKSYMEMFTEHRSLPEWGKVFSPDILAVRPVDLSEVRIAIKFAQQALDCFLSEDRVSSHSLILDISTGQQQYVVAQRRNTHTFKVLASCVGKDRARQFIDETLFPSVKEIAYSDECQRMVPGSSASFGATG